MLQPKHGATALRRDQRTQAIVNQTARNAFAIIVLAIGGIVLYFGPIGPADMPLAMLRGTCFSSRRSTMQPFLVANVKTQITEESRPW